MPKKPENKTVSRPKARQKLQTYKSNEKLCNIIVLNEEYTDVPICFSDLDSKICPICAILACPKAKERLPGKKELKPTKDISAIGHKNNQHKRPTAPATGLNFYKKAKDPLPRSEF